MAAPGTLIPADILSAKDTAFKPYNPIISKIPILRSSNDSGPVYSKPKPLFGEGSSPNSTVDGSLPPYGVSSSVKVECLPPVPGPSNEPDASSSGVSSRVTATQSDHLPSSTIGTSLYKGGRGTNAVGDGVRMNVNVVPYGHTGQEDSKSLFADLNPFQIKGTGKTSLHNKPAESKIDEYQRQRNNPVSGRPPVPMMWKNQHPYNEIPRKKEYGYMEGILPKINREPNNSNLSTSASTSSTAEKFYPHGFKSQSDANLSNKDSGARSGLCGSGPSLESSKNTFDGPPVVEDLSSNSKEENLRNEEDVEIGYLDRRKCTHDRFMGTNLKLKDLESPSSSVDSSTNRLDQIFDDVDVSECEIPWEDLVLGERIGLGSAYALSRFFTLFENLDLVAS